MDYFKSDTIVFTKVIVQTNLQNKKKLSNIYIYFYFD